MADVKVEEVMTRQVVSLDPTASIHEAAEVLAGQHISGAPVVEAGKIVGLVSEGDLIAAVMPPVPIDRGPNVLDVIATFATGRPHPAEGPLTVNDVMSRYVLSVSPKDGIWHAASLMDRHGFKRLPVVTPDGSLVGIVARSDVVRAVARTDESIVSDVVEAIRILGEETIPDLNVRGNGGCVTIRGIADRRSTHDLAIRIASRVPGVMHVTDRLRYRFDDLHAPSFRPLVDAKDPRLDWHGESLSEVSK